MNSRLVIVSSVFKDLRCQSAPKARIGILRVSGALSKPRTTIPAKKTPEPMTTARALILPPPRRSTYERIESA